MVALTALVAVALLVVLAAAAGVSRWGLAAAGRAPDPARDRSAWTGPTAPGATGDPDPHPAACGWTTSCGDLTQAQLGDAACCWWSCDLLVGARRARRAVPGAGDAHVGLRRG